MEQEKKRKLKKLVYALGLFTMISNTSIFGAVTYSSKHEKDNIKKSETKIISNEDKSDSLLVKTLNNNYSNEVIDASNKYGIDSDLLVSVLTEKCYMKGENIYNLDKLNRELITEKNVRVYNYELSEFENLNDIYPYSLEDTKEERIKKNIYRYSAYISYALNDLYNNYDNNLSNEEMFNASIYASLQGYDNVKESAHNLLVHGYNQDFLLSYDYDITYDTYNYLKMEYN